MAIYSRFSREKLWFSIVMLNYQRVERKLLSLSDPHPETRFWHSFWHTIWKYILHIYSGVLSDILSGIYFDILSGILSGTYSDIFSFWLSFRHSIGIYSFQAFILAFFLASILTLFLTFFLPFYVASILTVFLALCLTELWSSRLRSCSGHWAATEIWSSRLRSHWDLALAVRFRQCPLRSGVRCWGKKEVTLDKILRLTWEHFKSTGTSVGNFWGQL